MRFGTFQLQSIPPWSNSRDIAQQHFDQIVAADKAGFYEVWLAEHNARDYAMMGNTAAFATAVAVATKNVRIATAVARLPVHHPLHLAEDLAYADVLSKGRIDFGVGKGYDELEFETYNVPFEEREERWEESFEAIRQIWQTGSTQFKGKFFNFAEGKLLPELLQKPELPIFVMVSGSERSLTYAAERLLPVAYSSGVSAAEMHEKFKIYGDAASAAGYSDEKILDKLGESWQLKPIYVAQSRERAIEEYRQGLEWYMGALANRSMFGFSKENMPIEHYVENQNVILGSPDDLVDELADYSERSGISNLICWINMGGTAHSNAMNAIETFGREVIPRLTDVRGPVSWRA